MTNSIYKSIILVKGWNGVESSGSEQGLAVDSCEHCIEPSGFIHFWEILEQLSNCWLVSYSGKETSSNPRIYNNKLEFRVHKKLM
jgi:hypothetical protein